MEKIDNEWGFSVTWRIPSVERFGETVPQGIGAASFGGAVEVARKQSKEHGAAILYAVDNKDGSVVVKQYFKGGFQSDVQ